MSHACNFKRIGFIVYDISYIKLKSKGVKNYIVKISKEKLKGPKNHIKVLYKKEKMHFMFT